MEWAYTKSDFETSAPYEQLMAIDDPFLKQVAYMQLEEYARSVGVKSFKKLFQQFVASKKGESEKIYAEGLTSFTGQPMELRTGDWRADDFGVYKAGGFGGEECYACPHPIMPVERLTNIDTGIEKLRIAFCKGDHKWKSVIVDRRVLASRSSIVSLADMGIAVTSENAPLLVRYLSYVENQNFSTIPESQSVGRLGWISDEGFAPYVDGLIFDGEQQFKKLFTAVKPTGKSGVWLDTVKAIRQKGVIARIALAASFASPLVRLCDALPFFVHLWGGAGSGKTVGIMLAASVWANPSMGEFAQTFNSTAVGHEMKAGFLNSLPLILDDLQLLKNRNDNDNLIYQLCEGVGKTRGSKNGGLQNILTWRNCMITTGEQPIINHNSGGGAALRVIEIDCKDEKLFDDPHGLLAVIRKNYGHAGKEYIKYLQKPECVEAAAAMQKRYFKQITDKVDVDDKQAMSASLLLTADFLSESLIFRDGIRLSVDDISDFLVTKSQASVNDRAYDWLIDFVSSNYNRFVPSLQDGSYMGECWGCIDSDYVYFIKTIFDVKMQENGFNSTAFLSWAQRNRLLKTEQGRRTMRKRMIGGTRPHCVCIRLPFDEDGFRGDGE